MLLLRFLLWRGRPAAESWRRNKSTEYIFSYFFWTTPTESGKLQKASSYKVHLNLRIAINTIHLYDKLYFNSRAFFWTTPTESGKRQKASSYRVHLKLRIAIKTIHLYNKFYFNSRAFFWTTKRKLAKKSRPQVKKCLNFSLKAKKF